MKPNQLIVGIGLLLGMTAVAPAQGAFAPHALCKEAKAKAAGKQAGDLLMAYMRNEKRPDEFRLAANISKSGSRFERALSQAEARGVCSAVDDAEAIAAKVDAFVGGVLGVISPFCGDGLVAPGEQCDVPDDTACPGHCLGNCTCMPCGVADWPTCGGACPLSERCADIGFGCGCVLAGDTPCGGSFPTCDGGCPAGQTCSENDFFGCVCIPDGQPPCGDAQAPTCDGACRPGLFCVTHYDDCVCFPVGGAHPCGSLEGAPSCLGGCPCEAPICSDLGGVCTCTAYPSRVFLDGTGVRFPWL